MARSEKEATNLQVFRGSRPRQDVFAKHSNDGCCATGPSADYDKLDCRVRFDNALAHSNPTGANDKFIFPLGSGFAHDKDDIIKHINANGVGASVSILTIPTYAFITGIGIHVAAEEPGLTFTLALRNDTTGIIAALEDNAIGVETSDVEGECCPARVLANIVDFPAIGALGSSRTIDYFLPAHDVRDTFVLEADELMLVVDTMPSSGVVTGAFEIQVSVSYNVIHRAES
jgi:hypothetical protein